MSLPLSQTHSSALAGSRAQILASSVTIVIIIVSTAFTLAASYYGLKLLLIPLGFMGCFLLIRFPEFALGCLMVVGTFKATPQLGGSPIDLTVVLVLALAWSIGRAFLRESSLPLPKEFLFYFPIVWLE